MGALHDPRIVWELTRECDLGCRHCPSGENTVHSDQSTYGAYKVIDQIVAAHPRELIFSGGDPLERRDIYELIEYARRRGLDPAIAVSPTSRLTLDSLEMLHRSGLNRVIFNIDGSSPERHEEQNGVPESFGRSIRIMRWARVVGLELEVNTLVTRRSVSDLAVIIELLRSFGIERWNLYFLVPNAKQPPAEMITPQQAESIFQFIGGGAPMLPFQVRTFEAPHYLRWRIENIDGQWSDFAGFDDGSEHAVGSDRTIFITSSGEVHSSEFLPLVAGNVHYRPLSAIYDESDLFVSIRDRANLKGKCGRCEYRQLCGGSRARAWATTGDMFASDPLCAYVPPAKEVSP
jgi:radical SAM protein with 4Fe4S-binding SPASM domain